MLSVLDINPSDNRRIIHMKSVVLALAVIVGATSYALAADIAEQVVIVDEATDWSGVYVGITAGVSDHDAEWTDLADDWFDGSLDFGSTSGAFGVYAGYNWIMGPAIVGVEGDFLGAFNSDESGGPTYDEVYENDLDWLASIRGRVGLPIDRILLFATGGIAFAGVNNESSSETYPAEDFRETDSTLTGFAVGGGIEYAMTSNFILRLDGLYYDFGSDTYAQEQDPDQEMKIENRVFVVRAGIGYKF